MSQLNIYKASAGSGKTFRLTEEYLKLVFKNPDQYTNILAVTFTNKATGEMKSRILGELYLISQNAEASKHKDVLLPLCNNSINQMQLKGQKILSLILHDYSNFSISTIDSFFQRILRSFAKETGISGGYNVEMDTDKVLREIVDELMLRLNEDKDLARWLCDFSLSKTEEKGKWDIEKDIIKLGKQLFTEQYQDLQSKNVFSGINLEQLHELSKRIYKSSKDIENKLSAIGTDAIQSLYDNGLELENINRGKTGPFNIFLNLAKGNFEAPIKSSYNLKVLEGLEETWTKKANKVHVNDAISRLYGSWVRGVQSFNEQYGYFNSLKAIRQYFYAFGILSEINILLQNYREENNTLLISDAAQLLRGIIDGNDAPFIYEKTGTKYRHYLIDEFQDTSTFQWANFKPLVTEAIAQGGMGLIVGDVKQSIYRWRGGDLNLLLNGLSSDQDFDGMLNESSLTHNYRSCVNVIKFNNTLFHLLPQILKTQLDSQITTIDSNLEKIATAYDKNAQKIPSGKTDNGGFVQFTFLRKKQTNTDADEEGNEVNSETHWKEEVKSRIPGIVRDLQDKNYRAGDIAFIVRTARQGKDIADILLHEKIQQGKDGRYNFNFISNESLYLSSSSAVRLLIAAIRYLVFSNDILNLSNLVSEYQLYIKPESEITEQQHWNWTSDNLKGLLPTAFLEKTEQLKNQALYEISEQLIEIFELQNKQIQFPYLQAFQEILLNYTRRNNPDIISFLLWWEEEGNKKTLTAPEDADAIRIITIHKSKGLEFKAVIVPFCDWKIDHETAGDRDTVLWCGTDQIAEDLPPYLPVKYSPSLVNSLFESVYADEKTQAYIDNLNLLYVALTRAEEVLYCFSPYKEPAQNNYSTDRKGQLVSDFILYALEEPHIHTEDYISLRDYWKEEDLTLTIGTIPVHEKQEIKVNEDAVAELKFYPVNHWKDRIRIRKRSHQYFTEADSKIQESVDYGKLIHELLAGIHIANDAPKVLQRFVFEGKISDDEKNTLEQKLQNIFKNPQVAGWFEQTNRIKAEHAILLKGGQVRIPDRVVLQDNKAIVIDFKTGKGAKKYAAQVREYTEALKAMGHEQVEGYLLYIGEELLERVV